MMKIQKVRLCKTICKKQKHGRRVSFLFGMVFLSTVMISPSPARSETPLGIEQIEQLYGAGQYQEVVKALGGSEDWNSAQSLYLGLSHLRLGNTLQTIKAWQNYVRLEQGSEGGRQISQYLTRLLKQEAARNAKEQLIREKQLAARLDPKAIAVYPFKNKGSEAYAPLSKGLAAMVITDLSKVKGLTVVERIQIQAVLNELKLAKSGIVDPISTPRAGKLVGASKFTTGSLLDLDEEKMRIDATVTQTESGKQVSSVDTSGELASFYTLQKMLVFKLLCGIGYCPESLDKQTRLAIEKIHTKNFKAFRHYSEGLEFFDEEDYRSAARSFVLALEEDPDFALARKALLETPLLPLNTANILSGAEAAADNKSIPLPPASLLPPLVPAYRLPVPVTAKIFQQPPTTGGGQGTAPVTIEIEFP
ncbi:MAG: CsgG/HfaB family protein [Nitrospiria bacterium]